ncbi:cadherin-like beta sandwich domain-containing protein [Paenibacillus sp. JCM 10914]|uniref:cadherin-like beta sandwich domain-containing protein n=1 Tax=Paenibacillus sp. JCM 10914 TaxID=1236974 RepID=UPI0003CC56AB|nr:cadherin-like beta sandwich domain-containing protein [Paenibacillus sp. JCM 10914]GAE08001.1 hypothetical protein JCM10914_4257 [Paenibacillus sp. JCM 10914]
MDDSSRNQPSGQNEPETGEMQGYDIWADGYSPPNNFRNGQFSGGVYDGQNLWLIPAIADHVLKIDTRTGDLTRFNNWPNDFNRGSGFAAFNGGIYDGRYVWMAPSNANQVVRFDTQDESMEGYSDWPEGFQLEANAFSGAVYHDGSIWFIPSRVDQVLKIDTGTKEMTTYQNWPSGFSRGGYAFNGGLFDGENIWMVPYSANQIIKMNAETGEMTGYTNLRDEYTHMYQAAFDGQNLWAKPSGTTQFYKIDTSTGEMRGFDLPSQYNGTYLAAYDDLNVWLIPTNTQQVIRLSSVPIMNPPRVEQNEVHLSWEPVNGATGYTLTQSLNPLAGGVDIATVTGSVYTVTNQPEEVTHYYTVRANYPGRESIPSNEVSATVLPYNTILSGLTLSSGELRPAFSAETTSYTANVSSGTSSIMLTPTVMDARSVITINGEIVDSGSPFGPVPLRTGNNAIEIEVTAQNGVSKIYTITVVRQSAPIIEEPIIDTGGGEDSKVPTPPVSKLFIDLNGKKIPLSSIDLSMPEVTLEADPRDNIVYATIPDRVLTAIQAKNEEFTIEIKAPYGSYHIPVHLSSFIPKLGDILTTNKLSHEDMGFRITLTDKSSQPAFEEEFNKKWPNSHVLGSIVEYKIEIIHMNTDQTIAVVDKIDEPLIRQIPLRQQEGDSSIFWGAFSYDERTKTIEFVPARKVKDAEGWIVEIASSNNELNIIAENNVLFDDMVGHWGEDSVRLAAAKGLVHGIGANQFAPSQAVTKKDFIAMLFRALGKEYAKHDEGSNQPLTRQEMAGLLFEEVEWGDAHAPDMGKNNATGLQHYEDRSNVNSSYADSVDA